MMNEGGDMEEQLSPEQVMEGAEGGFEGEMEGGAQDMGMDMEMEMDMDPAQAMEYGCKKNHQSSFRRGNGSPTRDGGDVSRRA